jgi:hypothetical protein
LICPDINYQESFNIISSDFFENMNIRMITAATMGEAFPRSIKNYHKINDLFSTLQTRNAGPAAYVGNIYMSSKNN